MQSSKLHMRGRLGGGRGLPHVLLMRAGKGVDELMKWNADQLTVSALNQPNVLCEPPPPPKSPTETTSSQFQDMKYRPSESRGFFFFLISVISSSRKFHQRAFRPSVGFLSKQSRLAVFCCDPIFDQGQAIPQIAKDPLASCRLVAWIGTATFAEGNQFYHNTTSSHTT